MPMVSVITVCYNAEKTIQTTIESVLSQTYTDYEFIIIDGASTDRTREIIEPYAHRLTRYISEPDKGIYDAMNKGILMAEGQYCYFMNADDSLFSKDVFAYLFAKRTVFPDVLIGNVAASYPHGLHIARTILVGLRSKFLLACRCPSHQGTFTKRQLFMKHGLYDMNLHMMADFDYLLRLSSLSASYEMLGCMIALYGVEGVSSRHYVLKITHVEYMSIIKKYFNSFGQSVLKMLLYIRHHVIPVVGSIMRFMLYRLIRIAVLMKGLMRYVHQFFQRKPV